MRLILVRHGESEWNARGRVQGQADPGLTEAGREEARRLAPLVAAERPQLVVASDLRRAFDTALLLGAGAVERDPRWRESAMGDWTGADAATLLADPRGRFARWRDGREGAPGGEAFDDIRARVRSAVADLARRGLERVAVVTHGGPVRAACAELAGLMPWAMVPVPNASLTMIETAPGRVRALGVRAPSAARPRADA